MRLFRLARWQRDAPMRRPLLRPGLPLTVPDPTPQPRADRHVALPALPTRISPISRGRLSHRAGASPDGAPDARATIGPRAGQAPKRCRVSPVREPVPTTRDHPRTPRVETRRVYWRGGGNVNAARVLQSWRCACGQFASPGLRVWHDARRVRVAAVRYACNGTCKVRVLSLENPVLN